MNLLSVAQVLFSAFAKPKQHVVIQETPPGRVIDIGGGGEGVIGQGGGDRPAVYVWLSLPATSPPFPLDPGWVSLPAP